MKREGQPKILTNAEYGVDPVAFDHTFGILIFLYHKSYVYLF